MHMILDFTVLRYAGSKHGRFVFCGDFHDNKKRKSPARQSDTMHRKYILHLHPTIQQLGRGLLLSLLVVLGTVGTAAAAAKSSSPHYGVSEVQFGSGSSLHECSDTYCAKTSAGDLTVGSGSSAHYSAQFGFNTTDVPLLEVIAENGTQDMGVLDTDRTGTATGIVKVRNYLSKGYVIQLAGPAPTQGAHNLNASSTPTTSQQGTEQFGINLVNNSTPDIGSDPDQVPSGNFSFGAAMPNYSQANKFMYHDGDIIAKSDSSTGETDYTISFIANVSSVTPAGRYNGTFSAVVVPTF